VQSKSYQVKNDDATLTHAQRGILNFHLGEELRIKMAVLAKANLAPPKPPNMEPGQLRKWLFLGQVELWQWRRWWAVTSWPETMEKSFQEVFADEEFRKTTIRKWNNYLRIPPGIHLPFSLT
jgi:hypothetical protein